MAGLNPAMEKPFPRGGLATATQQYVLLSGMGGDIGPPPDFCKLVGLFLRVFRQPGVGLDHHARAFLALAVALRHDDGRAFKTGVLQV